MANARKPAHAPVQLPAPPGLRSSRLAVDGETFLVLSYSVPSWKLPETLTHAERDVVLTLLEGASRREIAERRGTSQQTVGNILTRAFRKLGVRSRLELARRVSLQTPATPGVD